MDSAKHVCKIFDWEDPRWLDVSNPALTLAEQEHISRSHLSKPGLESQ
jgi:hypothetical protein